MLNVLNDALTKLLFLLSFLILLLLLLLLLLLSLLPVYAAVGKSLKIEVNCTVTHMKMDNLIYA